MGRETLKTDSGEDGELEDSIETVLGSVEAVILRSVEAVILRWVEAVILRWL